ncbi:hypothetical protein [Endozoicomonas sp. SESOKO3]|uniref:hypothetical protein n=3 Tax=unclassified Endozoicomonas TaxID=2644528 RepID=UPI0021477ABC|nr:hypothetical protein [Endozoicomonas sp. SESOKO3]
MSSKKTEPLPTNGSLLVEQKCLYHRKTIKIKTLEKPEGYFSAGEKHQISLMKDYLDGNTEHFSGDDWLYLIIKLGNRFFSRKKQETLQKEFSTTHKIENLFKKIAKLQALRCKIEDIVHYSHLDRRFRLYEAAKKDKHLFPAGFLDEIIELAKNNLPLPPCATQELLYATASLDYDSRNPFFSDLIIACYRNSHFLPPDIEMGHKIEKEIKKQILKESSSNEDLEIELMLSDNSIIQKVCGGRSIQLTLPDNQTLYLKFQRKDESWNEFTRELKMHNSLHHLFSDQDFASEIPLSKGLFSISADIINKRLEDELEIFEGHIHGYCFSASKDYVNYACQLDPSNSKNPHYRSEEGLKKAAIDIGKYARYGLSFDSLIKSQHTKDLCVAWSGLSKWMTLGQLSSYHFCNNEAFPGSICNWVEDTERSDLSWSGLRDLGDSQIFETTLHSLPPENALNVKFFPKVGNLLAFFNALMDNIVAIVIVYARGKRLSHEFHYQNPKAVEDVQRFIGDILEHFIRGYYATDTISLQQALELDNTEFEKWLHRTSLEIVYWSAMQPYEMTEDFFISRHDHKYQNYFLHINQNKRPDPEIMKTSNEIHNHSLSHKTADGRKYNFGLAHMYGFPLQALIKGLCKLSINILENSHPPHDSQSVLAGCTNQ